MYQSPISIYETAMQTIMEQRENAIFAKVQDAFDVQVDKAELIRALQYDRDQYKKGYADGRADTMAELVRCKDCKHWHGETGWCNVHSHFVDRLGDFCYPEESGDWKDFDADYFCKDGERKEE